jgi:ribonuclease D
VAARSWRFESSPGHHLFAPGFAALADLAIGSLNDEACWDQKLTNHLHRGDLSTKITFTDSIAVDTETMGLRLHRDRLCVVQLSAGDGDAHLVQILPGTPSPHLAAVLSDPKVEKIFHFARFDLAIIQKHLGVMCAPVYCTRTASRLVRTNTEKHGLKDLCRDLIGVEVSKQQQSSDWGAPTLTQEQIDYAAADVLYLHRLKESLEQLLERDGRKDLADACFKFLPDRAALDLAGWADEDIFAH